MKIGLTFTARLASTARQPVLCASQTRGLAHFAESSEQNVPVPLVTENLRSANKSSRHVVDNMLDWADAGDEQEEFDSPETIAAIAETLESLGHEVELLGDGQPLVARLAAGGYPDLVLNFAEGHGVCRTREARVPALLEMLDIPYTGSDPLTLAATLDKDCAKRLVAQAGWATPKWILYRGDRQALEQQLSDFKFPLIVKPAYEGSSKGVLSCSVIRGPEQLFEALDQIQTVYRQPVLIEEFIVGDELTVGVLGNNNPSVLGVMRVLPKQPAESFVYSLEVKRDWEAQVSYECPARLSEADFAAVEQTALGCWQALGCRDVSRIDFRLRRGVPYFLETNPLPGLSPVSGDLVFIARFMGWEYKQLIQAIVAAAVERHPHLAGELSPAAAERR